MKNIFALLFILLLFCKCQPNAEQKNEKTTGKASALVIISAIQEKVYDQPSVKGLGIALTQPQETLQVLDTTHYFFYKVRLHHPASSKEGYILKAAFTDKPQAVPTEDLGVK